MSWFSRRRSRQTPPISLILLLVGFILVAFVFIGFRQLRGAQERRLRLLAGFGERVESTVEDLADRFVRIVKVPEAEEEENGNQPAGQRDNGQVNRYLKHVPHISLIDLTSECNDEGEGAIALRVIDRDVRLHYCPPQPEQEEDEEDESSSRSYLARIELESVIEPMIIPGAFDSILLADHKGRTLFQQGEPELRMLDLAPLTKSAAEREQAGSDLAWVRDALGRQGTEVDPEAIDRLFTLHENRPLELGSRTAMVEVEIAGSDYFVFLQPVSPHLEPPPGHGAGEPVQWIAAGIISSENLLSAGLTTSPFLLFILVSILPLGIVAWPFLKLSLITRRQPFHRLDLAALLFASILGIALAALLVFDLLFLVRLHGTVDHQLSELAQAIETNLRNEVLHARAQLVALDDRAEDLLPPPPGAGAGVGSGPSGGRRWNPQEACDGRRQTGRPVGSRPRRLHEIAAVAFIERQAPEPGRPATQKLIEEEIKGLILENNVDLSIYPYLDSVFWVTPDGDYGCANLPLRQHAVLPQNIRDRGYFLCARDCDPAPVLLGGPAKGASVGNREDWSACGRSLLGNAAPDTAPVCFQSFLDRTTGESVAAIALPRSDDRFPVAALVTRLTSVGHPLLPPGFGFAIVEQGGRVMFHSESRRDLAENFLKASDEDPLLRTMLDRRRGGEIGLHYWGQPTRIHVQPLHGLPWSLVTFRNTHDLRVRNFELIYDFLNPFLLYVGILLLILLAFWFFFRRQLRAYLWPSSEHLHLYRAAALGTALLSALFCVALLVGSPALVFCSSFLLPFVLGAIVWGKHRLALDERARLGRVAPPRRWPEAPAKLRSAWEAKRPWVPLVSLILLLLPASAVLLWTATPAMPVLVGAVTVCLTGALAWYWHSFFGRRRRVAFVFALGCVLFTVGLLPALGFLHLARSRQIQLHTQDTQMALVERVSEREREIEEREGPLGYLYPSYRDDLGSSGKAYLGSIFESRLRGDPGEGEPPWPYGFRQGGGLAGPVAGVLAARPFPLNDLSARPVASDLSRFDATEGRWTLAAPRRLVLTRSEHHGSGEPLHLVSTVPTTSTLGDGLSLTNALLLLGFLLLGASPFGLSRFLANRVLLISLVGQPMGRYLGRRATSVASTPLRLILNGVRNTEDVVKQVVLVATLPGRSAWGDLVEGSGEGGESAEDASPPFRKVDFREAWRSADREWRRKGGDGTDGDPEGEGQEPEDPAREVPATGGPPATPFERRAELFHRQLLTWRDQSRGAESEEAGTPKTREPRQEDVPGDRGAEERTEVRQSSEAAAPGEEDGSDRGRGRRPVLLTQFDPALDDPEAAADQVAALRMLTVQDECSVVILAETVPDPELVPTVPGSPRSLRAQRLWTGLLATYGVEYGHDPETHRIEDTVFRIEGKIKGIFEDLDPRGKFRESLHAIQRNLKRIERECSPTPVLRNIGWSMLEDIEDVLPGLRRDIKEARSWADAPSPRREMQGRIEKALTRGEKARKRSEGPWEPDASFGSTGTVPEVEEAARDLADLLLEAHAAGERPVELLRRAAVAIGGSDYEGSELLERTLRIQEKARPDRAGGTLGGDPGSEARWSSAITFLQKAGQTLWEVTVKSALRRRRLDWANSLLQLITREHVLAKVGTHARLHYRYLWSRCTTDEKLVLVQLSENGLVNPKYFGWVMDLMNRGLVVRDPELRVMNESFQRFILQEVQRSQILEWQEEEGPSGWSVLKWILPAPLILVAGFLFVTQRDALSNVTGVLVAAISLAPLLVNLYSQFREVSARQEAKEERKGNKDEGSDKGSK